MSSPLQTEHCVLDGTLRDHGVTIGTDDSWALLRAPVKGKSSLKSLLRANAAMRSRWRAALDKRDRPVLLAELALGEDDATIFQQTRTALLDARFAPDAAFNPSAAEIEQWCRDAGWEYHTRRDGGAVTLTDAPPEGCVATFERDGPGLRLSVEFEPVGQPSAASTEAISWLLLRAASMVRLARPVLVRPEEDTLTPRFDIFFFTAPTTALLDAALGSLSMVAQLAAAECAGLASEKIAGEFLAMRAGRVAVARVQQNN